LQNCIEWSERHFGQIIGAAATWSARPLDLDIIVLVEWRQVAAASILVIPHPAFRERAFVLKPLASIARDWRDPVSNLGMIHLLASPEKATRQCIKRLTARHAAFRGSLILPRDPVCAAQGPLAQSVEQLTFNQ
jgi:7,8-dihydro-6-hydroxymethylpterin-pyrophosphokinase